jgi:hypothetical protein
MTTYHEERERSGMRSWSGMRWLVIGIVLAAIALAVVLLVIYSGGGSGGTGGGGY